jgi:spore coat protein H
MSIRMKLRAFSRCRAISWFGLMACVLGGQANAAAANPAHDAPEQLFGLTNLSTFHLTIAPDQWAIMEKLDQQKPLVAAFPGREGGPPRLGPGPGPGNEGVGPRPGPGGLGLMGIEFKPGTAQMEFEGRPFGAIRVRFKGNSSFRFARDSLKRSLKLDFNHLEKSRTFFGLTKLNLNNNAMDPSQMREALAYQIFRDGGVPAGRTAFAKVFITVPGKHDHAYAGLYTLVEQVDDRFLKSRFGTKQGMLLKPERIPGLTYLGTDWAAYTNQVQAKSEVTTNDSNRFIEFTKLLNGTDDKQFQSRIADYIDLDELLRFIALQGLLANLDSPLVTGHNYYLYLHPKTRKFIWLPWDLNEAFGGFNPAGNLSEQMDLSVDHPFTRVNHLAERLLQVPGIKDRYYEVVRELLTNSFNAARLFPLIDAMAATIRSSLSNDPMVTLTRFDTAVAETNQLEVFAPETAPGSGFRRGGPGGFGMPLRPRPPIKIFINQRTASVKRQLEGKSTGFAPHSIVPGPRGPRPADPPPG